MAPRRRILAIALLGAGSCWVISQSSRCSRWNLQGGVPSLPSQKFQGPTMTHFASLAVAGTALRQAFHRPCTSATSGGRVARSASFKLLGPEGPTVLLSSALIGLSTGFAVVLFEGFITSLEELREELPIPVLAPILGALALAALVAAFGGKDGLAGTDIKSLKSYATAGGPEPPSNWPLRAGANALSAAITLGSGNSLGPEAPAATLGANVAFGLGQVFSIFGAQAAAEETAENGTLTSQEDRELIEKALEGSKVVASLPGKELDRLLKYFQKVTLQEGDTLMKHGDEVSDDEPGLFVTKSGLLDVYVPDGEGEKKVFTYETSGAVVGELAVLFRAPRAATVKARTDAVLWSVDRKSFEACGGRSEGSMARMNQNPDALLASGAAAGVAAGFNAPIAGIFFASEVVRPADDNQLDLTTRLLAAAVSAAVVQSFLPGGPAIKTNDFAWEGGNSELLFFLLLGVLTGIMAYSYKKIAGVARDVASFLKEQGWPAILLPVAGALLTVALSVAVNSRVQFDGFGAVNEVLKDSSQPLSLSNINLEPLLQERGSTGLFGAATLLVLMATKVVATTFSSATGLVGGTFAPSIYVGACLGGALGRLMEGSVMAHSATTTYIVVGMASMLAANCSVPITSVVLAVELAGGASYEATLPLITGIGVALYVSAVLLPALLDGLDRNAALARLSDAAEDTGM
ncbi:CLC-E [Symbiodinium microadriaticum]|nr:CLC-E [Symbiodinium microadriaticum]